MEARNDLSKLAGAHRSLLARARSTGCACPDAVLSLGVALELHRLLMGFVPRGARALLDDSVVEDIDTEGAGIAENLAHLSAVRDSEPHSAEVDTLSAALLDRMKAHLDRCDRAVFRPLGRFYLEDHGEKDDSRT